MTKNSNIQYYVEGKDEEKLLSVLKTEMQKILPGKVQVFNVITQKITKARLMTLKEDTGVVLIFDTDVGDSKILRENIDKLVECTRVSDVLLIPQCKNLEDELVRSCQIRKIIELLDSTGNNNFKTDFIKTNNLKMKLEKAGFNIEKLWCGKPDGNFEGIRNDSGKIKIL